MNRALLFHTLRSQRRKLLVVALALAAWGALMPIIYATFGSDLKQFIGGNPTFRQFSQFGNGSVFTLPGSIALGFVHPIAVALVAVFAVGFATAAVAGERQRGTLEVLLSRPLSRRGVYATLLVAVVLFILITVAAVLVGALASATAWNVIGELKLAQVPLVLLNGALLFLAFAAIGLAASVSFDRLTPAAGVSVAVLVVSYFLEVLGSLWPDAAWLQPYSLFHYLRPADILEGTFPGGDMALLAGVIVLAVVYALVVFPRRDLAAPS